MQYDQQTHKQDFQTQARWALGCHSALEIWRCEKLPLRLVCGTRILWVGAVVCLPGILEVGAEGFAGQEPSKSSLHVVCLSRIQEVGAEGRLLAKDPKCWCCKPLAGCGCWKLALNLGAPGVGARCWSFAGRGSRGWRCITINRLLAADP